MFKVPLKVGYKLGTLQNCWKYLLNYLIENISSITYRNQIPMYWLDFQLYWPSWNITRSFSISENLLHVSFQTKCTLSDFLQRELPCFSIKISFGACHRVLMLAIWRLTSQITLMMKETTLISHMIIIKIMRCCLFHDVAIGNSVTDCGKNMNPEHFNSSS